MRLKGSADQGVAGKMTGDFKLEGEGKAHQVTRRRRASKKARGWAASGSLTQLRPMAAIAALAFVACAAL